MSARCRTPKYKENSQNDAAMSVGGDGNTRRDRSRIAIWEA